MKKTKLLSMVAVASATLTLAPLTTTLTSCGNNYYKKKYSAATIDVAEKLVDMNKNPRCTSSEKHWWNLSAVRQWIFNQAARAGVEFNTFKMDNYGNFWFDVRASEGCETWQPLILQGHMDMVVTGLPAETKEITPIDTVIDWKNGTVHSRDFKTSVGADDGAGIAMMLNLIQDKTVKHGPLRIFCSADEDSGMIGAAAVYEQYKDQDWNPFTHMGDSPDGTPIKYLLNIDAEELGEIYRGCAGSATYTASHSYVIDTGAKLKNQIYIDIAGFKGGHSGGDLSKDRANADKCIFEILYALNKDVQIVKHYHPSQAGDISFQRNAIVPHARILINTAAEVSDIQKVIDTKITEWKSLYKGEDWNSGVVKITCGNSQENHNKFLTTTDSSSIIKLIGPNVAPEEGKDITNFWYGYLPGESAGTYTMCANVSPVEIKLTQTNNIEFKASSQTRTRDLKNFQKMEECYKNLQFEGKSLTIGSRYYPWDSTKNPNLVNITNKSYEDLGVKVKLVTSTGGVEPSWWQLCNPDLNCAGVGATIIDAHGMTETLYLNTIQPVLDCIKKVMLTMETAQ